MNNCNYLDGSKSFRTYRSLKWSRNFWPQPKGQFHFHAPETSNAGHCPAPNPRLYILRFLIFILISLCNLHLRFQNDLVSSTFPPKILYAFIRSSTKYTLTTPTRPPWPISLTVFFNE